MAGDPETGVSIMRLTAGLDSGPVCLQAREPIHADDDYATLAARLETLGGELLVRALDDRPAFAEQDEADVTYADKLGPADRTLDPGRPAEVLERAVRALRPHVGARLPLPGGDFLGVVAARVSSASPAAIAGGTVHVAPVPPGAIVLDCRGGALELAEVQPPGGRPMAAADWLRGRAPLPYRVDPRRPEEPVAVLAERAVREWSPRAAWQPAAEGLARRGDAETLDALRALARDPRPAARAVAATVLGQLGAPVRAFPEVSAAVLGALAREEAGHEVLSAVAAALGHLGEPWGLDALLALHRHPDAEVRDAVAFALLGREDPRARDALEALADDPDPRIREWAALG